MKQIIVIFLLFSSSIFAQQDILFHKKSTADNEHWLFNSYTDTSNGSWNSVSPLIQPLCGITSCYVPSINKILLCGGINSSIISQRACFFYNPVNNSFTQADSLPSGRAFGKLLLVRDSLYLVGSVGANFNVPDGALYKYSLDSNKWQVRASTPVPYLQEMASCVWNDSLIITIGGSIGGFSGVSNSIRIYNPFLNSWRILTTSFNIPVTSAHAEYMGNDLVVVGGYSYNAVNKVYHTVFNPSTDTVITWNELGQSPFGSTIYRVAGGKWANYMLFGPAIHDTLSVPQVWGLNITDTTWRRFLPNIPDSVSNISSLPVITNSDSVYFYVFGGILNNSSFTSHSSRYSFVNPYIGVSGTETKVPVEYKLFQNFPNPFNPSTTIKFEVPASGHIILKVFDVLGRETEVLVNEYKKNGTYEVKFDASSLASGVYYYTLFADGKILSGKMIFAK